MDASFANAPVPPGVMRADEAAPFAPQSQVLPLVLEDVFASAAPYVLPGQRPGTHTPRLFASSPLSGSRAPSPEHGGRGPQSYRLPSPPPMQRASFVQWTNARQAALGGHQEAASLGRLGDASTTDTPWGALHGPPTPSRVYGADAEDFVPHHALHPLRVSYDAWHNEICRINLIPISQLREPVALVMRQALHVYEYEALQSWILPRPQLFDRTRRRFINPASNNWALLAQLRRIELEKS